MFENGLLSLVRLAGFVVFELVLQLVSYTMTEPAGPGRPRWVSVTGAVLWGLVLGGILGLSSLLVWPEPWLPGQLPDGFGLLLAAVAGAVAVLWPVGRWRVRRGLPRQAADLALQGAVLGAALAGARWVGVS